jgi:hypothetical protein
MFESKVIETLQKRLIDAHVNHLCRVGFLGHLSIHSIHDAVFQEAHSAFIYDASLFPAGSVVPLLPRCSESQRARVTTNSISPRRIRFHVSSSSECPICCSIAARAVDSSFVFETRESCATPSRVKSRGSVSDTIRF